MTLFGGAKNLLIQGIIDADTAADGLIREMVAQGKVIDNLKINKLLFFADGVHFVLADRPLVEDDFEAWVHGPVIPKIYRRFKSYGWQPFGIEAANGNGPTAASAREAIAQVVEQLGDFDGPELERRSHEVPSFIKARAGLPIDTPSNAIVPKEESGKHFQQLFS